MTAIALDLALLARLAAHAQLLAFALRTALTPASVVATVLLTSAPNLVIIVAGRMMRHLRRAIGTCILVERNVCAVRNRRIHCWARRLERAR